MKRRAFFQRAACLATTGAITSAVALAAPVGESIAARDAARFLSQHPGFGDALRTRRAAYPDGVVEYHERAVDAGAAWLYGLFERAGIETVIHNVEVPGVIAVALRRRNRDHLLFSQYAGSAAEIRAYLVGWAHLRLYAASGAFAALVSDAVDELPDDAPGASSAAHAFADAVLAACGVVA